jgi:hypothetical protein
VAVLVWELVTVGARVGVAVPVSVSVGVRVADAVGLGVTVGLAAGVRDGDAVGLGVGVLEGDGAGCAARAADGRAVTVEISPTAAASSGIRSTRSRETWSRRRDRKRR